MESIKELVGLVQQVGAVMDDIGNADVIGVDVLHNGRARVTLSPELFYESFRGFKIDVLENRRFKFRLSKVIQGVEFSTLTNDLNDLKAIKLVQQNKVKKEHKKSLHALACE